ncbi:MAG: translocation/assembly module TamB [Chlamydiae bacterium]|nr:translocation/assembly module TamB [Chlamydiota bacterium]
MKNLFKRSLLIILWTLSSFLVLLIGCFTLLQTPWCKNQLRIFINEKVKSAGFDIEIFDLDGIPPFKWAIKKISLRFDDGSCLELKNVKIRIAFFPLMEKKLIISFLNINDGTYQYSSPKLDWTAIENFTFSFPKISSLPCSFAAPHVMIRKLHFLNNKTLQSHSLSIYGDVNIKEDLTDMRIQLHIAKAGSSDVLSDIFIEGSEQTDWMQARLALKIPSTDLIDPILPLPFEVDFALKSAFKGPWKSFKSLVLNTKDETVPIQIAIVASADGLTVPTVSFLNDSWKTTGSFLLYPSYALSCKKLSVQGQSLELVSQFEMNDKLRFEKIDSLFSIKDLGSFSSLTGLKLDGSVVGKASWTPLKTLASLHTNQMQVQDFPFYESKLWIKGANDPNGWTGRIFGSVDASHVDTKVEGSIKLTPDQVSVTNLSLNIVDGKIDIEGFYNWDLPHIESDIVVSIPSIRVLRPLVPEEVNLDGSLGATLHLSSNQLIEKLMPLPDVSGHIFGKNLRYGNKFIGLATVDVKGKNLSELASTQFSLELENVLSKNLFIQKCHLITQENGENHPFTCSISGIWKEPLSFDIRGNWHKQQDALTIQCDTLTGTILQKTVRIDKPFSIYKGKDQLLINHFLSYIDDSQFLLDAHIDPLSARITTRAEHLPLNVLTISTPGIYLDGTTSFDGMLDIQGDSRSGYFNMILEEANLSEQGKNENFSAKGSIQAHLCQNTLQLFGHLYANEGQFIDLTGSLPIQSTLTPFSLLIPSKQPISAELIAEGHIEAIFDFINIGNQKAKGLISSRLFASGSLQSPSLLGEVTLQNGVYENYVSGTRLKNIEACILSCDKTTELKDFKASGAHKGTLIASGFMNLVPEKNYPFKIDIECKDTDLIQTDMIEGTLSGTIVLEGSTQGSSLTGQISVPEAIISVSESLPETVPTLPITYIHRPIHLEDANLLIDKPYPLNYDLQLCAKDDVIIRGRGLNSEWKGDLRLMGNNKDMAGQGKLRLIKGDYTFSGKKFSLTQGEIDFTGKEASSAFLKILGILQLPDMQVQVMIQGALERPTLTLQSIPYMPTSAILARILFNKDISEITAVQAIQLANMIVSMSGTGGPDLLEAIRKSIGVDRLTIVGKEGSDEVSLQIGWYLSHGVTVSLSQSATSSDVTVEVDLKHGFIFQAETQNQEEGKFSLKWNKNY